MNIGFIGLGAMGQGIVPRLIAAGHRVTGWNRSRDKAAALLRGGMHWADSPRDVARQSEAVFSIVTDAAAVRAVALGEHGVISGLTREGIYLDMSTIAPDASRAISSEFEKAGLTPVPALKVKHPRIGEAAASFECKVERRINFGPERELVIGEILRLHAREGIVDPRTKRVSEEHYRPIGRLFASRYCTTRERFNLPGKLP